MADHAGAGARAAPRARPVGGAVRAVDDDAQAVQRGRAAWTAGARCSCSTSPCASRTRPTAAPVGRGPVLAEARPRSRPRSASASLCPPRAEELDAVVGRGVVRGREHDAEVGAECGGEVGDGGGRAARRGAARRRRPTARPATTAASRNSPEARGSRPTTATGRCPSKAPTSPRTWRPRPTGQGEPAVRSRLATPRTPSVPNSVPLLGASRRPPVTDVGGPVERNRRVRRRPARQSRTAAPPDSTLAVLRSLTGLLEAVLLALLGPRRHG